MKRTVQDWLDEIDRGLEFRRVYGREDHWHKLEQLFYNDHPTQRHNPGPNILLSQGDALLSVLSVPNPVITVRALQEEAVDRAPVVESVDNMLIRDLGIQEEVNYALTHAFIYGVGVVKLGYDSEFGLSLDHEVDGSGATLTQYAKNRKIEFSEDVRPGYPWVRAVCPHDIVVPWGTRDLDQAPWIAHRLVRHIDDLRADPKYENTRSLEAQMSMEDWVRSYDSVAKPYRSGPTLTETNKAEYVEFWEIHCRATGHIYCVSSTSTKFLRSVPNMLEVEGLPFVSISFTPRTRSLWVTSDAFYLLQCQAELLDITMQGAKQRRLSVLKFLYDRSLIAPSELEKAMSPNVGVAIEIDNKTGRPISEALVPFQPPNQFQLYQDIEGVRRNAREAIGMSANQTGEFDRSTRRTAFEAKIVDDSSRMRMSRRHIALSQLYTTLIGKMNAILFRYWRRPRTVEVLGPDGSVRWEEVTGTALRGNYLYDLYFTADTPNDRMTRKQEAIQLYVALSQDPTVDPAELRRYLSRAFNDPSFNRLFKPGILQGNKDAYILAQMQQQQMLEAGGGLPQAGRGQEPAGSLPGMRGGGAPV